MVGFCNHGFNIGVGGGCVSDWIFFSIRWRMATEPTTDPSYILQLPMAKAGVKALDTIENFLTSDEAPEEVRPH